MGSSSVFEQKASLLLLVVSNFYPLKFASVKHCVCDDWSVRFFLENSRKCVFSVFSQLQTIFIWPFLVTGSQIL